MRPRIVVNLVFFAVLGVVMTVWAFSGLIELDAITRPYRVDAEFASSPGLVEGVDVAYLGVHVGKVGEIRLAPGKIVVGLDLGRDVRLPQGVTAAIRRKSAIGEPYVELSPPSNGTGGPRLAAGDVIPLAKTSVPVDYRRVFEGVGRLLGTVPPDEARTIVHELATGLDGRSPAIRGLIDDAHDLTATLAGNAGLLDDLAGQLTRLTGTLAGRRDKIAAGVRNLAAVTGALRRSREDLDAVLARGPSLLRRIDGLLTTARPGLSCLLTAAAEHPGVVFTPRGSRYVHHVLAGLPTALAFARDITDRRADGVYARTAFVFSVPGGPKPAVEYDSPLAPPTMPAPRHCPEPPRRR
ncbi:MCE family protein [Sphaerisporangium fuscum]|uniref:MCE family protein n=1 Tax=Sphaerisporangium fuscum TaxID=2835868 RepID=UPI001BDC0DBC|nr:MCE family protein [Sphaerisporangium fuscum]